MPSWAVWAILAAGLALGELFTPGMFFLGPAALAAVAAGVLALAGAGVVIQLLVFIAVAIASVAVLRPLARSHIRMPALMRTGTAALEGTKAVVLERVDANGGRVRIGGEDWTARPFFDDQVIEAGVRVEVAKIQGATALVFE